MILLSKIGLQNDQEITSYHPSFYHLSFISFYKLVIHHLTRFIILFSFLYYQKVEKSEITNA